MRLGRRGQAQRQGPSAAAAHTALCNGSLPVKAGGTEGGPSPAESDELQGGPAGAGAELATARPEFAAWADDSGSEAAGCRPTPGLGWASDVIQARCLCAASRCELSPSFPIAAALLGSSSSAVQAQARASAGPRATPPPSPMSVQAWLPTMRSVPAPVKRRGIGYE